MITISPKSIALQFNECITNADLKGLANLMTEDHVFCDTANNRIKGKDNNIVQAWEPFFNFDPGYRNIFENIVARGSTVIMQGHKRTIEIWTNEGFNTMFNGLRTDTNFLDLMDAGKKAKPASEEQTVGV